MPNSCTYLYIHFVWATWDRLPLLTGVVQRSVYACAAAKCVENRSQLLRIGGIEDHVHVLVRVHPTVAVAWLAKEMKGASAHLIAQEVAPETGFKWQGSYGAFSVSTEHVDAVCDYIERQAEHHARNTFHAPWERCAENRDVP